MNKLILSLVGCLLASASADTMLEAKSASCNGDLSLSSFDASCDGGDCTYGDHVSLSGTGEWMHPMFFFLYFDHSVLILFKFSGNYE